MAEKELFGGIEPTWRVAVAAEFCRIEEVCARAARAQWETVRIWRVINLGLGSCAIIAAGVAGSFVLAGDRFPGMGGALALFAAVLTPGISMGGAARKEKPAGEAAEADPTAQKAAPAARPGG